ncbi:MAG TPA: GNAT family N-acetyltransferase [Gemmatimonadales bacterium]|nr:GNAT family N-acetyltransferase [Gemmatimonadales bacterium]
MDDRPVEWHRGEYTVSTRRDRLDADRILGLLRGEHWGSSLTRPVLERAVAHSVSFGLYHEAELVGFGRVVTDLATYGYLTDVAVSSEHRGLGLGAWLIQCMLDHPELQGFRRLALVTRDAEQLYARAGFTPGSGAVVYMERRPEEGQA